VARIVFLAAQAALHRRLPRDAGAGERLPWRRGGRARAFPAISEAELLGCSVAIDGEVVNRPWLEPIGRIAR